LASSDTDTDSNRETDREQQQSSQQRVIQREKKKNRFTRSAVKKSKTIMSDKNTRNNVGTSAHTRLYVYIPPHTTKTEQRASEFFWWFWGPK
jgi:hypothetical protein